MVWGMIRPWLAVVAVLVGAGAAQAQIVVRYDGTAQLMSFSTGDSQPGPSIGNFGSFSAVYVYDDFGTPLAGSLFVNGLLRSHNTRCRDFPTLGSCEPLSITPTSISSGVVATPEDFSSIFVSSPTFFGDTPLLGAGRTSYSLVAGDTSNVQFAWSIFDNGVDFAWVDGVGSVSAVTVSVPEPANWALLIAGFGMTGAVLRRRRATAQAAVQAA